MFEGNISLVSHGEIRITVERLNILDEMIDSFRSS